MKRTLLLTTALLLLPSAVLAHEYWLLPDRFTAAPGEPVGVAHRVGTGWPGESLPRVPSRIVRFALIDARGERLIGGEPGADPAGAVALRAAGTSMAVYRSQPSSVTLDAASFESYLRDEGLEHVIAWRAANGESQAPGVEIFSRNAKALLAGEGPSPAGDARRWQRPVGLTLELVPESDPRLPASKGPLAVRLLYRGKPLANALVKAFPKDGNERRLMARTDRQGRAHFTLGEPGIWLVSAVHMIDAPPASGARWESLWSSLTFERPAL
ncbi:MAG: DUF4198 domain-containing protein [Caldimonas sp.]